MTKKKALIAVINGQDGYFLTNFLNKKNYEIYGFSRSCKKLKLSNSPNKNFDIKFYNCDITNEVELNKIIKEIKPHEIYNLASQSRPSSSWKDEQETFQVNIFGAVNIFRAVLNNNINSKIFHASSSEMFGASQKSLISEKSSMEAVNPYGISKISAHNYCKIYRETYNLFISTGIMFNHESQLRPLDFLSQKITYGAACAKLNILNSKELNEIGLPIVRNGYLELGNLNVKKDWGFAGDYIKCMWLMLQKNIPDDYIIGTGKLHSIKDMCKTAYESVGLDWEKYIKCNSDLKRVRETNNFCADVKMTFKKLNWKADTSFQEMIKMMVLSNIDKLINQEQE